MEKKSIGNLNLKFIIIFKQRKRIKFVIAAAPPNILTSYKTKIVALQSQTSPMSDHDIKN